MLDECVVLFGGAIGERVEPVGVVACAVVNGPSFHALGHAVGKRARDGLLVLDGCDESVVSGLGQIFIHFAAVEHGLGVIGFGALGGNLHGNGLTVEGLFYNFES